MLDDIPKEFLKVDSVPKANIMKLMKNRLMALQEENKRLLEEQHKPLYQRIMENLGDCNYYETNNVYYCLHSGLVLLKKKYYPTLEDALAVLDENVTMIFKDQKILCRKMSKQHSLQSTLLRLLTRPQTDQEDQEDESQRDSIVILTQKVHQSHLHGYVQPASRLLLLESLHHPLSSITFKLF